VEFQYPAEQLALLMLAALRQNPQRQATTRVATLPSPVGGLNARDALQDMPPSDALILDNVFPEANYCKTRKGYRSYATGCGAAVQTLFTYFAPDGEQELFAGANGHIWDVTSLGAATSAYSTSITVNKWQWVNFTNTGGSYIIAVNGADTPLKYNGSAWSTTVFTGSIDSAGSASTLIYPFQFKERIFFCQDGTLDAWYAASEAISGTLTKFPLGGVAEFGGSLIAGASFSFDAGASVDNYCVFLTSNGEALVYMGTNPNTDFVLHGIYQVGYPVGNRPIVKIGGDIVIITTQGAVPLSQMIVNDRSKADRVALTAKIQNSFNAAAQKYKDHFGWEAIVYPHARYVIFNVPEIEGTRQRQFVMNVISGSWCRFTNLNGNCWGLLNNDLFFGGNDGTVYQADYGQNDNGSDLLWEIKTAFTYCGSPNVNKYFNNIQPLFLTSGTVSIAVGVNVDFDDVAPTASVTATPGEAGVWGVGKWGACKWAGSGVLIRDWKTVGRFGSAVAARCKGAINGVSVQFNGFNIGFQMAKGTIY
jgi:hypothetical protein